MTAMILWATNSMVYDITMDLKKREKAAYLTRHRLHWSHHTALQLTFKAKHLITLLPNWCIFPYHLPLKLWQHIHKEV